MSRAFSKDQRIRRLRLPQGRVRVVIDTESYTEIDDQFAVAYALMSEERMSVEAVYAPRSCATSRGS